MSSVKFRLNAWFVLIITALLLASGAYNYYKGRQALLSALNRQVDSTLQRLSVNLPNAIWNFDKTQIEQTLTSEMSAPFIRGIILKAGDKELGGQVRDADGNLAASQTPPAADDVRSAELTYMDNGKANPVGKATVYLSYDEINATLNSALFTNMVQILVLDIILVLALSRILSANILNPLAEIGNALRDIAQGEADLTKRLPPQPTREFAEVAEGFNTFVERLEKIVSQVSSGIETITHGANEIANGNMDLSSRTESQASSLEQTSAAMDEMTGTVRQNAQNAQLANQMAAQATEVAAKGGVVVTEVVQTMDTLNKSSHKIVDIISVIDSIAFQTNILALNAAVEAARAGEQGRGFAVVASEVRSLAGRSAAAAKEIKELITESVNNVTLSSKLVDQAGSTMTEIVDSVKKVTSIMNDIHVASSEQNTGIGQINEAIRQMDSTTQQNAALVEQAAAAAGSMQHQAAKLSQVVGIFRLSATGSQSLRLH